MKVNVIDTDAGSDYQQKFVPAGTTVRDYFQLEKGGAAFSKYQVLVNRGPASPTQELRDGDTLTISAAKPIGA